MDILILSHLDQKSTGANTECALKRSKTGNLIWHVDRTENKNIWHRFWPFYVSNLFYSIQNKKIIKIAPGWQTEQKYWYTSTLINSRLRYLSETWFSQSVSHADNRGCDCKLVPCRAGPSCAVHCGDIILVPRELPKLLWQELRHS